MKDTSYYFSHDYNTRQDIKIKKLLVKHGMIGYGCFWSIIEDLYNNANALPLDYESIAYDLRVSENVIDSIINDFDLFIIQGGYFGSKSVENRLNQRNEKSIKASKSALKRWNKAESNANDMQTHSESNAIKEIKGNKRKEKEIKGNDIIISKNEFSEITKNKIVKISSFKNWNLENFENEIKLHRAATNLAKDEILNFYDYWRELTPSGKMRFQLQKSWQTDLRLKTWERNLNNFPKTQTKQDDQKSKMDNAFNEVLNQILNK
jgi:hypothetical protein